MRDILRSFSSVILQADPSGAALEPLVFAAWKRCVDGAMAENVVPVRFEGSRLMSAVSSETWRRQVADLGPVLAEKLNAVLGSPVVKYIRFEVDPDAVRQHRDLKAQSVESAKDGDSTAQNEVLDELAVAAEQIGDEQLRKLFLSAASGSLGRQKDPGSKRAKESGSGIE